MLNLLLIEPSAFAAQAQSLRGSIYLQDLNQRIWSSDIVDLASEIHYFIQGGVDRWQRPFLDLSVSGSLKLYCQRCMQPTEFLLDEKVHIVLFPNEECLDEAMLADETLDGMLLKDELDIHSLLEDQILMALPISPKHDDCTNVQLNQINQNKPNPFAVLADLKKG